MIAAIIISVSRRLRSLLRSRGKGKAMRLNTETSVMLLTSKGKTVFKFINH